MEGDFVSDSSSVINRTLISVTAVHFGDSYLFQENWGAFNDYGSVLTSFVSSIGIVKKHHLGWSFERANNYWELIEYKLR